MHVLTNPVLDLHVVDLLSHLSEHDALGLSDSESAGSDDLVVDGSRRGSPGLPGVGGLGRLDGGAA